MMYLENINSPDDVKKLTLEELHSLCAEIREYITTVIPTIGGHFASSLGTVELSVALHYIFNTPEDKIVWDVGHQAYVHKILTGRREGLKSIRQFGGISGFLKRTESEYDAFGAGHASTAISAALGMAVARDLQEKTYKVISIIGDGGITGGLAYEGLNNAGMLGKDLIIILNDNKMSISPNVGAISQYLTNIITDPFYNRIKKEIWDLTGKVPAVSTPVRVLARRMEESFKNLIVPGMLFEDLGLKYFGPIDGHNLNELISLFNNITQLHGPLLLHVVTQKGKGVEQAEADPCKYHGVKPPKPVSGEKETDSSPIAFTNVFGKVLLDYARKDPKIIAITAAMTEGTGLVEFRQELPGQFFDVGIAEGHAVTFAGGMATEGYRPVCAIYSTFLQRAFDHIIHDIALQKLPVIFCIDRAGLVGEDGPTHHGVFDLSYLSLIPHAVIAAPENGRELNNMMKTAFAYDKGPFFIRYPKENTPFQKDIPAEELTIGSWETVRYGKDVVILAVGSMVQNAVKIGESLAGYGLDAEVVNCRFVKPFDENMLHELAGKFRQFITIEENSLQGGFGAGISAYFNANSWHDHSFLNLGIPDNFITHGKRNQLLELAGLSFGKIETAVFKHLGLPVPERKTDEVYVSGPAT